jgi:hypothetical protein
MKQVREFCSQFGRVGGGSCLIRRQLCLKYAPMGRNGGLNSRGRLGLGFPQYFTCNSCLIRSKEAFE